MVGFNTCFLHDKLHSLHTDNQITDEGKINFNGIAMTSGANKIGLRALVPCRSRDRFCRVMGSKILEMILHVCHEAERFEYGGNFCFSSSQKSKRNMGCNRLYKDTAGFSEIGGKRESERFDSDSYDAGHPGFCTPFCASVSAIYNDPLADLEYVRFS